jgi:peptidoglycan L-alanyl-D-glutamate endopeptidase CwlK
MAPNSITLLNQLHPKLRQKALQAYGAAVARTPVGVHPVINQTIRSFAESDHDYELGRTIVNPDGKSASKPMGNIISDAKGGSSWHNYGLALDFYLLINGRESWNVDANWMIVVNAFKEFGFNWGGEFPGDFKDYPHLECKLGQTLEGLLELHQKGKFIKGTQYVDF